MSSDPNDTQNPPPRQLPPVRHRERRPQVDPTLPPAVAAGLSNEAEPTPEQPKDMASPSADIRDDGAAAYRQPPRKYQFKPGQSGNPRGRPKGARSLPTLVDMALSKPITAQIRGRSVKITAREAMVMRYVDQAMKGDLKAFAVLLKLDPRARHDEADEQAAEARSAVPDEDVALIASFLKRSKVDDGEDDQ